MLNEKIYKNRKKKIKGTTTCNNIKRRDKDPNKYVLYIDEQEYEKKKLYNLKWSPYSTPLFIVYFLGEVQLVKVFLP